MAADFVFNLVMIYSMFTGVGEVGEGAEVGDLSLDGGGAIGDIGDTCGLSFSSDTLVATSNGEQAISSLQVGDQVQVYDPQTHQQSTQTVEKVWINHDTDLLDVTVKVLDASTSQENESVQSQNGATQPLPPLIAQAEDPNLGAARPVNTGKNSASPTGAKSDETIHTTANHPWLTADQGWVQAGKLTIGEPVVRADGKLAVVVAVQVVPGTGIRYDLTVSHIHDFEVGYGRWIVHNCGVNDGIDYPKLADQEANDIHDGLGPKFYRNFGTVGVGYYEEGGEVKRVVTTSQKLSQTLRNKVKTAVGNDFYVDALGSGDDHAEDYLLRALDGKNVLGIGTSNHICTKRCEPNVLNTKGGRWPRHLFGSPFQSGA